MPLVQAAPSGVLRNALVARLTMLVSLCFTKPRDGDRHLHQAINMLGEGETAAAFQPHDDDLSAAITTRATQSRSSARKDQELSRQILQLT
ncbi:hypothetical protein [Tardiphaga sp. 862_B3_N1_1]|uniref:hypothetical protein n=1 Tax=Tardiphaga sp. 862_B3_N1_1 TaxID=3240763 RepID=UPI003F8C4239